MADSNALPHRPLPEGKGGWRVEVVQMKQNNVPLALAYADFIAPPGRIAFPDVCCDLVVVRDQIYLSGPETHSQPNGLPLARRELLRIDPFVIRKWLGIPLRELVNRTLPLVDINRKLAFAVEALIENDGLRGALSNSAPLPDERHDRVEVAARLMRQGATVASAAFAVGVSSRQLERLFKHELGMSPRQWKAILRFRRAGLAARRGATLGEAALAGGYADQAHFTRESKALTGKTPRALIAQHVGIVQDAEVGRF